MMICGTLKLVADDGLRCCSLGYLLNKSFMWDTQRNYLGDREADSTSVDYNLRNLEVLEFWLLAKVVIALTAIMA